MSTPDRSRPGRMSRAGGHRTAWGAQLRRIMQTRTPENQSPQRYWADRLGVCRDTISNWWMGKHRPAPEIQARLREEFPTAEIPDWGWDDPGLAIPPCTVGPSATWSEHRKKLVAEQERIHRETGRVRLYSLAEIGGEHVSRERVRQIMETAIAKVLYAMAWQHAEDLEDIGATEADIATLRDLPTGSKRPRDTPAA